MSGKHHLPGKADEPLLSDDTRKVGRPTKFSDETIERLCAAIGDGMPIRGACVVAGIGVTTLTEWREKYPDLEERIADARENARLKALQGIKAAGEKDWRAWAEWLKLTHPTDYRGSGAKIQVSALASVSGPVISEEKQREMQEIRQRMIREQKEG
jgi:hypothetical protein